MNAVILIIVILAQKPIDPVHKTCSKDIFVINSVLKIKPRSYIIKNSNGQKIIGAFIKMHCY